MIRVSPYNEQLDNVDKVLKCVDDVCDVFQVNPT